MKRRLSAIVIILALIWCAVPVNAQDLVQVADLAGGSSVFVFRNASRATPRVVTTKVRPSRTKTQRIETAKRVSKQYVTLAKVAPRRNRSETVRENDPRVPKIATMPREQASVIFAGVGEYFMESDQYPRAQDYFRESMQLDPKNSKASAGLSEALALEGNEL